MTTFFLQGDVAIPASFDSNIPGKYRNFILYLEVMLLFFFNYVKTSWQEKLEQVQYSARAREPKSIVVSSNAR